MDGDLEGDQDHTGGDAGGSSVGSVSSDPPLGYWSSLLLLRIAHAWSKSAVETSSTLSSNPPHEYVAWSAGSIR